MDLGRPSCKNIMLIIHVIMQYAYLFSLLFIHFFIILILYIYFFFHLNYTTSHTTHNTHARISIDFILPQIHSLAPSSIQSLSRLLANFFAILLRRLIPLSSSQSMHSFYLKQPSFSSPLLLSSAPLTKLLYQHPLLEYQNSSTPLKNLATLFQSKKFQDHCRSTS